MANRSISEDLHAHLKNFSGREIVEFKLSDEHLSPVRNQGDHIGSCSFVATITCIEMLYRKLNRRLCQKWDCVYYFDLNECSDLLYNILKDYRDTMKFAKLKGTRVEDVLLYAMEWGFLPTSVCVDPREKNELAHFNVEAYRYKISSYKTIKHDEVLTCLETYPVIAYMAAGRNILDWKEAIYNGGDKNEEGENNVVLVVGSVKLNEKGIEKQYLIVQYSHGTEFGFRGYFLAPFEGEVLFRCFWLPVIYPGMMDLPYGVEVQGAVASSSS